MRYEPLPQGREHRLGGPAAFDGEMALLRDLAKLALLFDRKPLARSWIICHGGVKINDGFLCRLLRILYAMMRDGKRYERGPVRDRTRAANAAKQLIKYMKKKM